jgi:hypothetical protein
MLARKQKTLMSGAKSKKTMTIFEQAQQTKEHSLAKLKTEMLEAWNAAQEPGIPLTANQQFMDTYEQIQAYRWQLKEDLREADYTEEELAHAAQRLEKIKKIEERGVIDSESTIPMMKEIWLQLVKTLLLQKDNKAAGSAPSSFDRTPLASKEPIACLARGECAKLNRLVIHEGELLRVFAARCKSELRFCTWLRELHTPAPARDATLAAQMSMLSKQIDDDIDTQLFGVLSSSLPNTMAYMRTDVENRAAVGAKFSTLCVSLEGEADFQKENRASGSRIHFLDTDQQDDHVAHVALTTRIAKDPKGRAVSEQITEKYHKEVSTNFKLKGRDKRRRDEEEDEEEEKDELPKVHKIKRDSSPEVDPHTKELWHRVLNLESQPRKASTLPCFDFAKGNCVRSPCQYSHDNPPKVSSQKKTERRQRSRSPPPSRDADEMDKRTRSRSPRRNFKPIPFYPPPPSKDYDFSSRTTSGKGGKGGKGKGKGGSWQQKPSWRDSYPLWREGKGAANPEEPYRPVVPFFPPKEHPHACKDMWETSKCTRSNCREYHGESVRDSRARHCPGYKTSAYCYQLWRRGGCDLFHGRKNV